MTPPRFNIADYLLEGKSEFTTALVTASGQETYGNLRRASWAIARYLKASGGKPADRVILMADNSFFWAVCYLGILKAGLICVPLPPEISNADLDQVLAGTEPSFALVQGGRLRRFASRFSQARLVTDDEKNASGVLHLGTLAASCSTGDPGTSTVARDLAALMFTSGSTGTPRGVMVSHGNIRANTDSIIEYMQLSEQDRVLMVLPFHYCFGTSLLHTHLRVGGSLVLDARFLYPESVLQRLEETRCTGFAGVPSHFQILLRRSSLRKKALCDLRWIQQAGGHLAPSLVQQLREAVPKATLFVMYGQTEATARLSYLPPAWTDRKPGSIGKGIPGVHLTVEREDGSAVGVGEVGEIVAEGENIAQGYWRAPQETAVTFADGRLHTGDLATVDAEGFITIVGRTRDFVKSGGKRVSCKQLEDQLLSCSRVVEAAVIGVPDEDLGEAIVAFIVPRDFADDLGQAVLAFCRHSLPFHLVPRQIIVVEHLPKNSAGKVLKEQLRAQASAPEQVGQLH